MVHLDPAYSAIWWIMLTVTWALLAVILAMKISARKRGVPTPSVISPVLLMALASIIRLADDRLVEFFPGQSTLLSISDFGLMFVAVIWMLAALKRFRSQHGNTASAAHSQQLHN